MTERLNAGICWKSFQYNNPNHVNNINDEGFTFLRIFIDLAEFPQKTPDNSYMVNIFNMPDGMWAWDNFSKRWWSSAVNDKVKNAFDYCKANNKLPIVCFGHSEEKSSWLTRSPSADKLAWLTLMATEFAEYLKLAYNFKRVDMESWNEPNECMSPSVYAQVTSALSKGWKTVYPYSWVHGFASNLSEQNYLNDLLAIPAFVKAVNAISPHILTAAEWNQPLINGTYDKCSNKGLKVTYLEVSPLDDLNRLHMLIDKCNMYAVVLWIRNSIIGQNEGIIITDALIYSFDTPNAFESINKTAMNFITTFNKDHAVAVDMSVPVVPGPVDSAKPTFINDSDWAFVKSICTTNYEEPLMVAAIGWHETHWGTIGIGRDFICGYAYFGGGNFLAQYKGFENNIKGTHTFITNHMQFPISLESLTEFAVNHWKSSVPTGWAASVYNIYKSLAKEPTLIWLDPMTKLTNNFRWGEFWSNNFGGPKIEPPKECYNHIFKLAVELQKVSDIIKIPIIITSGYRTAAWNDSKSVEGTSGSKHLTGEACDSKAVGMSTHEYFGYICRYATLNHLGCYDFAKFVHAGLSDTFTVFK